MTHFSLALTVYDTLISFPQEAKCIWKRKIGTVTILYVLIRYGIILDLVMQLVGEFYVPPLVSVSGFLQVYGYRQF